MIRVYLFLRKEKQGEKSLYVSQYVLAFIKSYDTLDKNKKPVNEVIYKLEYFVRSGFKADGYSIKSEGGGVIRIRVQNTGRIIGFFDGDSFIAISCFQKNKQKLTGGQIKIINQVKETKKKKHWIKTIERNKS